MKADSSVASLSTESVLVDQLMLSGSGGLNLQQPAGQPDFETHQLVGMEIINGSGPPDDDDIIILCLLFID